MKFTKTFEFDQDVDEIFNCYINEDFIIKKMENFGARNVIVNIEQDDDNYVVEISREMLAELPGALKRFGKPWNKMTQREEWSGPKGGPYYGIMEIDIQGVPSTISGQMKLAATENGSAAASITEVNSNIPFFGKTLTKFIAETSEKAIEDEFEYVKKQLN